MSVYIHDLPFDKSKEIFQSIVKKSIPSLLNRIEKISIDEFANGRVLAAPVWAKISSPHYHASAMDGFAIHAEDSKTARLTSPVVLKMKEQAIYVDTGDAMPKGFDAVIPIEFTEAIDKNGMICKNKRAPYAIRIRESVRGWQHVRVVGEDMVATQLVLPEFHRLQAHDLGALVASGNEHVTVFRRPVVSVIPTGDELVTIGTDLQDGDLLEFNSIVLAAKTNSLGGVGKREEIVKDDFNLIKEKVGEVAERSDLILLNAGSSAGAEDYSADVINTLGEVNVHGIAVRPGHPVILGSVCRKNGDTVPIIGVPGYPVSSALTADTFLPIFMDIWFGQTPHMLNFVDARLIRNVVSPAGDDDFVRVVLGNIRSETITLPLSRGAGVISSLVKADGLLKIEAGSQGVRAGEKVRVQLLRSREEIERTILSVGSHDITLDVLAQFLAKRKRRLSAAHVGSMAGLVALSRGETHISQSHLYDTESGLYNVPFVEKFIKNEKVKLIEFVSREQGFLVPKGNPKRIIGFESLQDEGLRFVNRQRGAGTRVLFDTYLARYGIDAERILGYEDEEFSHLSVAVAIKSGRVDFGMGIAAAAYAMDLDFVPICEENYQLVIPTDLYESALLAPLLEILADKEFYKVLSQMSGYRVGNIGQIVYET